MGWDEIFRSAKSISLEAKHGPLDFNESEKEYYAMIGKFLSDISRLEFQIDNFVFDYVHKRPSEWRSFAEIERKSVSGERIDLKRYPQQTDSKIHFFICTFLYSRDMLQLGDLDGYLDLNAIGYMLEEVFQFRNFLIHGSLSGISSNSDRIVFRYKKYTRVNRHEAKGDDGVPFVVETRDFSSIYLENILRNISYLSSLVFRARRHINGADTNKEQRDVLRGRALFREVVEKGIFEISNKG